MAEKLFELHKLTAQAKILEAKYIGGLMSHSEFKSQIEALGCHLHDEICTQPHHEKQASACREILDGTLRLYYMEDTDASK